MAATGIRVTLQMRSGDYAITEVHNYTQAAEISGAVQPAFDLMKVRMALSGYGTVAKGIRLSKEGVFRDSQVFTETELRGLNPPLNASLKQKNGRLATNAADQAKGCYLLRGEASDRKRKNIFLAGIPDVLIETYPDEGPIALQPWWSDLWDAYVLTLTTKGWGFVARGIPPDVPVATNAADVVVQVGTGRVGIVTGAAVAGVTVGTFVQARGFRRTNVAYGSLNGTWQVAQIAPDSPAAGQTTYYLRLSEGIPTDQITRLGTLERVEYFTYPYARIKLVRPTTRKRGNRSLVGPGRRQTRKRLPA